MANIDIPVQPGSVAENFAGPFMTVQFEDGNPIAQSAAPGFLAALPAVPEDSIVWSYNLARQQFEAIGVKLYCPSGNKTYLKIVCGDPDAHVKFTTNSEEVDEFSRRTRDDGRLLLTYGINLVRSMCWHDDQPQGNSTRFEVIVNGPVDHQTKP
jgi:hypothetical protein